MGDDENAFAKEVEAGLIKQSFKEHDLNKDGRLSFEEFYALLDTLTPGGYKIEDATTLFQISDQDLSGDVDVEEFIDWICGEEAMVRLFRLEDNVSEEEAKEALLCKPYDIRLQASKAVKRRGDHWSKMTWKERLDEVRDLEKSISKDPLKRQAKAPCKDANSSFTARKKTADPLNQTISSGLGASSGPKSLSLRELSRSNEQERSPSRAEHVKKNKTEPSPSTGSKAPHGRFAIAEMEQAKMIDYSLRDGEISFAGFDADVLALREALKQPCGPEEIVDIVKFLARGTAGWVFLVKDKESGTELAMKLIRMTQAPLAVKEWYVSKRLMEAGVTNVVFTYETVCVLVRSEAPPVVWEHIENAGPCPYYMCMIQELMPWGTLEDFAEEGELSPEILFRAMEDVSSALALMHENNLQHKDVKPENIMLEMDGDTVTAAKLCDFGSAVIGTDPRARADDIRRFGVTLYSVATGEMWTKNRLIHEKHDVLVSRLAGLTADSADAQMRRLPQVLKQILDGGIDMRQVATLMAELEAAY